MVVGLCTLELQIPGSSSLKEKRRVVRSVVRQVQNQYNVSIAEVGHQDSWQLATLAVVCVSNDAGYAHGLLEQIVSFVDSRRFDLVLLDYETEMIYD